MDQSVLDAVKRWPDVPAVFGWLSLTARGEWKLHPLGDAQEGGLGLGISNTQILGFMDRNYASQPDGAWFFQNGPQRVYVRLDAAPLIVHVDPTQKTLTTHQGQRIEHVSQWFCDESGLLYAMTDCGPARIDDRDLYLLAEVLRSPQDRTLLDVFDTVDWLEQHNVYLAETSSAAHTPTMLSDALQHYPAVSKPAPLRFLKSSALPQALHFILNPGPETVHLPAQGRKII